jgi:hypothetical protein
MRCLLLAAALASIMACWLSAADRTTSPSHPLPVITRPISSLSTYLTRSAGSNGRGNGK